jgi:hypothetical protein
MPGVDATGGQGGADIALIPSKNKGKVVQTIHNDDELSSDDDIPLQRWMWASGGGGSTTSGLPVMGQ